MSEQNNEDIPIINDESQAIRNINLFLTASLIPTAYAACKNKTYAKFISVLLIISIILLVLTTIFPCDDSGCSSPGGVILLGILIALPAWLATLTTSWLFASYSYLKS